MTSWPVKNPNQSDATACSARAELNISNGIKTTGITVRKQTTPPLFVAASALILASSL